MRLSMFSMKWLFSAFAVLVAVITRVQISDLTKFPTLKTLGTAQF